MVLPAASGKAVAPKLYGTGPEKPAALPPAAEPVQGKSVLPPELQEAADAQPPLELVDTPAPEPSKAPPPSHPERFDYIPLEPHGPAEIRENGDGEETSGRDRDR